MMTEREYSTPKDELLNAALEYAGRGWAVIPLLPRDKKPCYDLLPKVDGAPAWTPLREVAHPAEIQRWFDREPTPNLGIITGGTLAVADVDYPNKLHGLAFPITPMSKTSRGFQVYMDNQSQTIKKGKYPWGDMQYGEIVVAPPSIHKSGAIYEWYPFLSPDDVPLAPPPEALLKPQKETAPSNNIITRCSSVLPSSDKGTYEDLATEWGIALAILTLCGAEVKGPKKAFKCPLPGHEERHPSAALWKPEGGYYAMHDFHTRGDGAWWTLADVYAACTTGISEKLGKGERVVWWLRALEDIGAITVPRVPCPDLPGDAKRSVKKLYAGFVRLLSIRAVYDPAQAKSTPFTWTFAQGWCGIGSRHTVQESLNWLFVHGYIKRNGATPRGIGLLELGKGPKISL